MPPQPNCPPDGVPHFMRLVIQSQQASVSLVPHHITGVIWLEQLLATLNNQICITATSYSKVSRGLRFPLEISGLCTGMESSGDSYQGQWRPRYAIHASRHSIDKVLRYLKKVMVTSAVCQILAPLNRSLNYWYWAGVAFCTHHR